MPRRLQIGGCYFHCCTVAITLVRQLPLESQIKKLSRILFVSFFSLVIAQKLGNTPGCKYCRKSDTVHGFRLRLPVNIVNLPRVLIAISYK